MDNAEGNDVLSKRRNNKERQVKMTTIRPIPTIATKSYGIEVHACPTQEAKVYNLIIKNTEVPITGKVSFIVANNDTSECRLIIYTNDETDQYADFNTCTKINEVLFELPQKLDCGMPIDILLTLDKEGRLLLCVHDLTYGYSMEFLCSQEETVMSTNTMANTPKNKVYGIDLGTTYSAIAYVDESGKAIAIRNSEGDTITPSVVFFAPDGRFVVGREVKRASAVSNDNALRTIAFVKRQIGNNDWTFEVDGRKYDPTTILTLIIQRLVYDAKKHGGYSVKDVVITCPAYFGELERLRIRQAGQVAGVDVLRIIDEPIAAALYYAHYALDGSQEKTLSDKNILIYDLGGGTFDVTVLRATADGEFTIVCIEGDHQLGGFDWDAKIIEHGKQLFRDENGVDLMDSEDAFEVEGQLKLDAEENKKSLSQRDSVNFRIRADHGSTKFELTREKFDEITADLLERTFILTDRVLQAADEKGISRIDEILLVGGSTQMPQVIAGVKKRYGTKYGVEPRLHEPALAVAKGAALYAESINRRSLPPHPPVPVPPPNRDEYPMLRSNTTTIIHRKIAKKSYGIEALIGHDRKVMICNLILKQTQVPIDVKRRFAVFDDEAGEIPLIIYANDDISEYSELDLCTKVCEMVFMLPKKLNRGAPIDVQLTLTEEGLLRLFVSDVTHNQFMKVECTLEGALAEERIAQTHKTIFDW